MGNLAEAGGTLVFGDAEYAGLDSELERQPATNAPKTTRASTKAVFFIQFSR